MDVYDYRAAFKGFSTQARKGELFAQAMLGKMYADGRGVPQDLVKAANFYREAAQQHNAAACDNLAQAYGEGRGVALDEQAALKYYRQAAQLGHAGAKSRREAPAWGFLIWIMDLVALSDHSLCWRRVSRPL